MSPAKSKSQQMMAGIALKGKRGEMDPSMMTPAARKMMASMTETQLEHYASTKRKGLPKKK